MHYLSISTIIKGESLYIKDWVDYHLGLGVDHFYLYNNEDMNTLQGQSTISTIQKYFSDKVTIMDFPGVAKQCPAMMQCLHNHRNDSRWIAFMDVDEYLVLKNGTTLPEFLVRYESFPALCVHWRYFGSNGHKVYEDKPVVERFTRCATEIDRHVKSIINPRRTGHWVTVHKWTHPGASAVDEHFKPIAETDSRPEPATADLIQINHYVTKSYEECNERRNRLRADIPEKHNMPEFFVHHDRNEVEDLRALELWNKIKETRK